MNVDGLRKLNRAELADYLWKRLRRESPVDPPLGRRFGDEEPEQFIVEAAETTNDQSFRHLLNDAIKGNFQRVAELLAASGRSLSDDTVTDEQIASLSFLISELAAEDMVDPLYKFACAWFVAGAAPDQEMTFGQIHVLRTLAQLQRPNMLALFWRDLWENGPRSLRGLTIFGWARSDSAAADQHLGDLADSAAAIDLPSTVWSLIDPDALGIVGFGKASEYTTDAQRTVLREALREAGADASTLRDFDLYSSKAPTQSTQIPWLDPIVPDRPDIPRKVFGWPTAA